MHFTTSLLQPCVSIYSEKGRLLWDLTLSYTERKDANIDLTKTALVISANTPKCHTVDLCLSDKLRCYIATKSTQAGGWCDWMGKQNVGL